MIELAPLQKADRPQVLALRLDEAQLQFAGTPAQFLEDESPSSHLHLVKHKGDVIGFFKLDLNYSKHYAFCPESGIGLRFFVIDASQQGQGFGTEAAAGMLSYVKKHYPDYNAVYLTVNCKNPSARRCYLKAGFEDTGELYLGGAAGPQHIMRCLDSNKY